MGHSAFFFKKKILSWVPARLAFSLPRAVLAFDKAFAEYSTDCTQQRCLHARTHYLPSMTFSKAFSECKIKELCPSPELVFSSDGAWTMYGWVDPLRLDSPSTESGYLLLLVEKEWHSSLLYIYIYIYIYIYMEKWTNKTERRFQYRTEILADRRRKHRSVANYLCLSHQ